MATEKPKFSRYIWAIVTYTGQWTLLVLAVQGKHWAWNVFAFLMWLCAICAVLAAVTVAAEKKTLGPRAFGSTPALISDLAIACTCAAMGHFIYAVLAVVQMVFEYAAFNGIKEIVK